PLPPVSSPAGLYPPGLPPRPPAVRPLSNNARIAIITVAAACAVAGLVAVMVALPRDHGKPHKAAAGAPTGPAGPGCVTTTPASPSPTPEASRSRPEVRSSVDLNKVLPASFEGFSRIYKRTEACAGQLSAAAKKALKAHPCQAPLIEALYINKARTIKI